jgi:hypothetical protein
MLKVLRNIIGYIPIKNTKKIKDGVDRNRTGSLVCARYTR